MASPPKLNSDGIREPREKPNGQRHDRREKSILTIQYSLFSVQEKR
jgi:hypothetical protein